MQNALSHKVNLESVLDCIKRIKQIVDVPIVLFSYCNPLINKGLADKLKDFAKAGVDATLVVDLPLEKSDEYLKQCNINNIEPICLIAPSTRRQKAQKIAYHCHAFLYYVCRNGTTGVKNSLPKDYVEKLSELKTISNHPIVSGFGIGNRKLAAKALQHADGLSVQHLSVR